MKKNILYLFALILSLTVASCEDPEYVNPTADRQGITSLTAIYTSGPHVDKEMARLEIGAEMPDVLVIEVPWYNPNLDYENAPYITKARVQAALANNCSLSPALTVLDLTKENVFTYTNAYGESKQVIIKGELVKSKECKLEAFSIIDPEEIAGIVDETNKKVSLVTGIDLSAALASYQVSAHATIVPDPATTALDYNNPVTLKVIADNGIDYCEYTIVKEIPEKIASGFNKESVEPLFSIDPVADLGLPNNATALAPSLAAIKSHLIICPGDGSTPIYVNRLKGTKLGEINLGAAEAGSITNDEAENLLIVNHQTGNGVVNIYRTKSVTQAPELFYSFQNTTGLPLGARMKCIGNVDADALITFTNEGVDGVTSSNRFTTIRVIGGVAQAPETHDISLSWGSAPVNMATVVPTSIDAASTGYYTSDYAGGAGKLSWIKGDLSIGTQIVSEVSGWALNPNCLDSKKFNGVNYVALFTVCHFPTWGYYPSLYLYDVNNPGAIAGAGKVTAASNLVLADAALAQNATANGVASGDVVIAPNASGFNLYIYYYDHNSQVIGCYTADCIKRD